LGGTYIPDDERVVVLAAEGSQKLLVVGEGEALDEYFVQLQALDHLERVEVPDNNVGLYSYFKYEEKRGRNGGKRSQDSYLEAHVRLLAASDVLARA